MFGRTEFPVFWVGLSSGQNSVSRVLNAGSKPAPLIWGRWSPG